MEVSTFMTEQLKAVARMEARMDKQASEARADMEAQRLETRRLASEAKAEMEAQRLESRKQVAEAKAEMDKQVAKANAQMEAQRVEAKLEMEAQRLENDQLRTEVTEASVRAEMQAKVDEAAAARLRDQQLVALQGRLEALNAAKLLSDDELFAVEDVIGDSSGEVAGDDRVAMLLALSARMASDSAFARQLRRKVVAQQ